MAHDGIAAAFGDGGIACEEEYLPFCACDGGVEDFRCEKAPFRFGRLIRRKDDDDILEFGAL